MNTIALYIGGNRHVLEDSTVILSRANQALATLERYKNRLDQVSGVLSALEVEDMVTVRDVAVVAQRLEMVRRIAAEVADYVVELGSDGRLIQLQLAELLAGVEDDRVMIVRDYVPDATIYPYGVDGALHALSTISALDIIDVTTVAAALGRPGGPEALELPATPRGYRLLARVPRLPDYVMERIVEHFGELQTLLSAGIAELQAVEGVGETRARSVRESLSRLAESSIIDRYV